MKRQLKSKKKATSTIHEEIRDISNKIKSGEATQEEILSWTKHDSGDVRLKAVQQLCPCRVKDDIDEVWDSIMEMAQDEDHRVRYQVLHDVCDGSPDHLEHRVMAVVEMMNTDTDKDIRRRAHKVLASYLRTGKWNIL
eukprot:CAMPEP_0114991594 /NCGR_PEP_ID=MMETSP0216-20121206/11462_1 /TAXON_ID=223996 /ORGANISM="Protocruzia adherens, Strain Boccale" /LENGTH=137 /DNA_ID=CAMNT_0002354945 /DNA_START=67 /DNA_END=480 /DNA_ORIENTATION=+